ncbi:MAG: M24 family metallopeptidase [Stellaceae bacterium]
MSSTADQPASSSAIPFDSARLDRLMEEAGVDILLATSKHNVQYMLGGHRAQFFGFMDAIGISRYLPIVIYPKGAPQKAVYIGHRTECYQLEVRPFWLETRAVSTGSTDAMDLAAAAIKRLGVPARRLGIERAFLPVDAAETLAKAFPESGLVEALYVLERLRAVKSADELAKLRDASERIIDSMLAVIESHGPGTTKRELSEALRREETNRGMDFEYCLITAGQSVNRAATDQAWQKGDPLSLDSGGNYQGYIGDLCRMAVLGEPDAELEDLLGVVDKIQQTAIKPVRAGLEGGEIFAVADEALLATPMHNHMHFMAHGMGMIGHEAPRLPSKGRQSYPPADAKRPLETGMVLSLETTLEHPRRGFIKLEDTVAVTENGSEMFGTRARGWNRGGIALG